MICVVLPYPAKHLWPNGRAHWAEKARQVKFHRHWADLATMEALATGGEAELSARPIAIHIVVHPKPRGVHPDADNCVAAAKSYLDGIAQRLGVNDKAFGAPTVEFSEERT